MGSDIGPALGGQGGGPTTMQLIADMDSLRMGDIQRGAQWWLRAFENPERLAMILQIQFGVQDVYNFLTVLRAQCAAILTGGGPADFGMPEGLGGGMDFRGGQMPSGLHGGIGYGMGGGMLGGMGGNPFAAMSPRMGGSMASLRGGPPGTRNSPMGSRSVVGGHDVRDIREQSRAGGFNDDYDDFDGRGGGGRFRRLSRGERGDRVGPRAGGRPSYSGPQMYGAFLGFEHL
jgi:hypothetical protein